MLLAAVPRSTAGTVNVSEPAAATTASAADSQYAVPPGPITRLRTGPAVTEVVIAITIHVSRHLCTFRLALPRAAR